MRTLVLWDVDYTLLDCDGLGREAHEAALTRIIGRDPDLPFLGGRTDLGVIAGALRAHGMEPTPELLDRACATLVREFTARAGLLAHRGRALDGAAAAVDRLAADGGVVQSVLTGNLRPIAELKLAAYGLGAGLDLDAGAYGGDDEDRARLVALARERATERYGDPFDAATTVVIGDTPNDVTAGLRGGAYPIAVATGRNGTEELRAAGAEVVLAGLADVDALLAAIPRGSVTPPGRS